MSDLLIIALAVGYAVGRMRLWWQLRCWAHRTIATYPFLPTRRDTARAFIAMAIRPEDLVRAVIWHLRGRPERQPKRTPVPEFTNPSTQGDDHG